MKNSSVESLTKLFLNKFKFSSNSKGMNMDKDMDTDS